MNNNIDADRITKSSVPERQWAKRVGYYSPMNAADQDLSLEHHFGRVGS
jgi:hypothetical protein